MASWRETGYVPDSDEEEESQTEEIVDISSAPYLELGKNASESSKYDTCSLHNLSSLVDEPPLSKVGGDRTFGDSTSSSSSLTQSKGIALIDTVESTVVVGKDVSVPTAADYKLSLYDGAPVSCLSRESQRQDLMLEMSMETGGSTPLFPLTEIPSSSTTPRASPQQSSKSSISVIAPHCDDDTQMQLARESPSSKERPSANFIGGRSLRQRKPIQLNPYLIEQEKYKQTLRSRGLKPVKIADIEKEADSDRTHRTITSSQEEFDASLNSDVDTSMDIEAHASPPSHRPMFNNSRQCTLSPIARNEQEGRADTLKGPSIVRYLGLDRQTNMPEIIPVPQAKVSEGTLDAKRRKLKHTYSRRRVGSDHGHPYHDTFSNVLGIQDEIEQEQVGLGLQSRELTDKSMNSNNGNSDVEMTDTAFMGDENTAEPGDAFGSSGKADYSSPLPAAGDVRIYDLLSSSSDTEDDGRALRTLKRKTKGVLPASWWKIDMKEHARTKVKRSRKRQDSRGESELRPGIARIVRRRTRNHTDKFDGIVDCSDSEESSKSLEIVKENSKMDGIIQPYLGESDGSVIEDDTIDAILSRARTSRIGYTKTKPLTSKSNPHSKLLSSSDLARRHSQPQQQSLRQSKLADHGISKNQTKLFSATSRAYPSFGVVDAYNYEKLTDPQVPQFLRVATRTAKKQISKGRHKPTWKIIRLQTVEDTAEALSTIKLWRSNKLPFAKPMQKPDRAQNVWHGGNYVSNTKTTTLEILEKLRRTSRRNPGHLYSFGDLRMDGVKVNTPSQRPSKPEERGYLPRRVISMKMLQGKLKAADEEVLFNQSYARTSLRATPVGSALGSQKPASRNPSTSVLRAYEDELALENRQVQEGGKRFSARRKATPRRMEARDLMERAVDTPVTDSGRVHLPQKAFGSSHFNVLDHGLGFRIAVEPFEIGVHFSHNTFLGKGGLIRVLNTRLRPADGGEGFIETLFEEKRMEWAVYDETVASDFEFVCMKIVEMLDGTRQMERDKHGDQVLCRHWTEQIYRFYIFCVDYLYGVIRFSDSLDVESFARRWLNVLKTITEQISLVELDPSANNYSTRIGLYIQSFSLLLSYQIRCLLQAHAVLADINGEAELFLERNLHIWGNSLLSIGFEQLEQVIDLLSERVTKEIGDSYFLVEQWVLLMQITSSNSITAKTFWEVIQLAPSMTGQGGENLPSNLETCWHRLFSLLPFFHFTAAGEILECRQPIINNWPVVCKLAKETLALYSSGNLGSANEYLRTLLRRAYSLVVIWKWLDGWGIVVEFFEFFSKRGLSNLKNETDRGSVEFLQNLSRSPSTAPTARESCFHLFLKVTAEVIISYRSSSGEKRIRDLVHRLIPNHGRRCPKERDVPIEDLIALRNHHDLLCTLYWAAPPGCRPPVESVRYLVDPGLSHRQACAINITAWFNLIRFELAVGNNNNETLQSFMDWFNDIVEQTLAEHCAAVNTAIAESELARVSGRTIPQDEVDAHIRRNQRQLEGVLLNAAHSLARCFELASGQRIRLGLLLSRNITSKIFESSPKYSTKLLLACIDLLSSFISKFHCHSLVVLAEQQSEESQDYGDWSELQKYASQLDVHNTDYAWLKPPLDVYEAFYRMLSNIFGSDAHPEHELLTKVVDTWAEIANSQVQENLQEWNHFLGTYGRQAWSSLRDTEQTKQFSIYFLSKVISMDAEAYKTERQFFLLAWVRSLVEREATLKYQHLYTMAIVAIDSQNPLFFNFHLLLNGSKGSSSNFSLYQFKERRLRIISKLLLNIRTSYFSVLQDGAINAHALTQEYRDLLKALMAAMKDNFSKLTSKPGVNIDGYVSFVHKVVAHLQQYSSDLVPIDRFFMEPTTFPLPGDDPLYAVGRLKMYGINLPAVQIQVQATVFLLSVLQKAAIEENQDRLQNQIFSALENPEEPGVCNLREFFIGVLGPAFFKVAFRHPAGWIWGFPLLTAIRFLIWEMVNNYSSMDIEEISANLGTLLKVLTEEVSLMSHMPCIHGQSMLFLKEIVRFLPSLIVFAFRHVNNSDVNDIWRNVSTCVLLISGIRHSILNRGTMPDTLESYESFSPNAETRKCIDILNTELQTWRETEAGFEVCQPNGKRRFISVPVVPRVEETCLDITSDVKRLICMVNEIKNLRERVAQRLPTENISGDSRLNRIGQTFSL